MLKLASTGYRFVRYYAGDGPYRRKGPPRIAAARRSRRWSSLSTVAVFATGVMLLLDGPGSRGRRCSCSTRSASSSGSSRSRRTCSGICSSFRPALARNRDTGGGSGRAIALVSAVVAGAVVAVVLLPDFAAWTSAHFHHHHG